MAHLLEKAERCGRCGTSKWEWDPAQGGTNDAYSAVTDQCIGCLHRENAVRDDLPKGATIVLIPKRQAERLAGRQRS